MVTVYVYNVSQEKSLKQQISKSLKQQIKEIKLRLDCCNEKEMTKTLFLKSDLYYGKCYVRFNVASNNKE